MYHNDGEAQYGALSMASAAHMHVYHSCCTLILHLAKYANVAEVARGSPAMH